MKDKILSILREVFDDNNINESASQKNCEKWDSLRHLNMIIAIESELGISLEPEEIAQMKDFGEVLKIVSSKID